VDSDVFLIVGLVVAVMAFPAVISAFSAGKPPRAAAVAAVVGGALMLAAITTKPGGYRVEEIPDVAARVLHRLAP
jgi:hypothetical protein